jgi:hypothetical protein
VSEQQKVMGSETLWDPMSEQQTLMGSGTLWDPSWEQHVTVMVLKSLWDQSCEQPADGDGVGNSVGSVMGVSSRR